VHEIREHKIPHLFIITNAHPQCVLVLTSAKRYRESSLRCNGAKNRAHFELIQQNRESFFRFGTSVVWFVDHCKSMLAFCS